MRKSLIRKTLFVAIVFLSLNSKAHSQETFKGLVVNGDPYQAIYSLDNFYEYNKMTIVESKLNKGQYIIKLYPDLPTDKQVEELHASYLEYIKSSNHSPKKFEHILLSAKFFRETYEYTNTESEKQNIFGIADFIETKKGTCRPISIMYSSLLTKLDIPNNIIATKQNNGNYHMLLSAQPYEDSTVQVIIDIASNLQYKDKNESYGLFKGRKYLVDSHQIVCTEDSLISILYNPSLPEMSGIDDKDK